jgi:hypothetical protein
MGWFQGTILTQRHAILNQLAMRLGWRGKLWRFGMLSRSALSTPERSVNPTRAQIKAALPATLDFIGRFHNLRVIVFCGGSARYAMKNLDIGSVKKLGTYHTGNRAFHRFREHIRETFKAASELAAANQATPFPN